jgi:hypothetical protein
MVIVIMPECRATMRHCAGDAAIRVVNRFSGCLSGPSWNAR